MANPQGGQVVGGSASISGTGTPRVTVNQTSERSIINWNSFSIATGENTTFNQPNSSAVALNKVTGSTPSAILGSLNANGTVILENQNGILFGPGSTVNAGGLVATTHDVDNAAFMAGGPMNFHASPNEAANASVVNEGTITAADEGLVALVAPHVRNSGTINANLGRVALGAANGFTLDLYGDNLVSFALGDAITETLTTADGKPVKALVQNRGAINAAGGTITLTAAQARSVVNQAVNTKGTLIADSVTQQGGTIILSSSDGAGNPTGTIVASGKISANGSTRGGTVQVLAQTVALKNATITANGAQGGGSVRIGGGEHGGEGLMQAATTTANAGTTIAADATENGNGGSIVLWSERVTRDYAFISAEGGPQGGNGGNVEVSSAGQLDFAGTVALLAAKGNAGTLLLDPENVTISSSSDYDDNSCTGGSCTATGDNSIVNVTTLQNALANGNVTVSTGSTGSQTGNITVANSFTWSNGNLLVLSAAGGITINTGVTISNTYTGSTFGAGSIPVVLALRADSGGADSGYGVTNSGTINMSGSSGAVSLFNDSGFTAVNGTESTNGSWAAPSNQSVSSQFTTYKLVNSVSDLAGMSLSGTYALGENITGSGAFNSNTPLGTFTGILDGQWCALAGGSNCAVTGLTMTISNSTTTNTGLVGTIGSAGIVRNLELGMTVSDTYSGTSTANVGSLAGTNNGTIANVTTTSTDTVTGNNAVTGTSTNSMDVGGLAGYNAGTINGSSSSENVTYSYNGSTSSGTSTAVVGGLVGYNNSTATTSVGTSDATDTVTAQYGTSGSGKVNGYVGGLIGENGSNNAVATSGNYATGSVTSSLIGGNEYVGGLVGYDYSSSASAIVNSYYTTGTLSYTGAPTSGSVALGGLVGYNQSGTITGTAGTPNTYSYSTEAVGYSGTATPSNFYIGGLAGYTGSSITYAYATGNVSYSGNAPTVYIGGLVGNDSGNGKPISNINTQTGTVNATTTVSGSATSVIYEGGLTGYIFFGDTISNYTSSQPVTYTYQGTSTGTSVAEIGGVTGFSQSSITGATITGSVTEQYSATGCSGSACTGNVSTYIGGLVGSLTNGGAISNSTTTGTVSAATAVTGSAASAIYEGGLAGETTVTITGSRSSANVTYSYNGSTSSGMSTAGVGGLVGFNVNTSATSVSTSDATGTVTAQYGGSGSGNVNGYIGGLIGNNIGGTPGSYAAGRVTSNLIGGSEYVGGLIGYNGSLVAANIANSYATGAVSYTGSTAGAAIGGLVGYNHAGTISDTYATGYVSASAGTTGGLVASNGGTISASYWDTGTTGQSGTETGATGVSTATLQNSGMNGGLPSGWSSSTWSIVQGVSYPYLSSEVASGTPQVVSGIAYSDRGVTAIAGGNVSGLIGGSALNSIQTGGSVTTGANGYYYFLLAPSTISGSGSEVLTYLTGSTKGNAFYDNATGSLASFNIYGNELLTISASSALSTITSDLSTALGANTGSNFLFSLSSGAITATAGDNLEFNATASTLTLDKAMTTSSGGAIIFNDANAVTQSAAISTPNLLLNSGGTYTLTNSGNNIGTVAASDGSGTVSLNNGSNSLAIGTVSGTNGVTAATLDLTDTGTVTQSQPITATNLSLSGSGGTYTLTNGSNAVSTLAGNTGAVSLTDSAALTVGSIAGTTGLTATGAVTLVSGGSITFGNSVTTAGDLSVNASGGSVTIDSGAKLTASGSAEALIVEAGSASAAGTASGGDFVNNEGSDALSTPTSGAYWVVYTGDLPGSGTTLGSLPVSNWRYDTAASFAPASSVDSVFYRAAPTLSVAASAQSNQYGNTLSLSQSAYMVSGEAEGNGTATDGQSAALGGSPTLSTTATSSSSVSGGPYPITIAAGTISNPYNYQLSFTNGSLSVTPAPLTITANNQSMTYGGAMPALTASYSGFVNGDSSSSLTTAPTVTSATPATANAGTYSGTLTANGAVDGNYTIGYAAGTLTIGKAPLTVTANNESMTYGGAMPTLTASYTGLVNGDTSSSLTTAPTVSSATPATANAGTYSGTLTANGAADSNYAISYAAGTLTIGKAPLTVTANNESMTYGGAMPTLTASYTGLVNDDTSSSLTTAPTVSSATAATANAGTYSGTLTASGAVDANYTIGYVPGTLTIGKAPLTITANSQTVTYGGMMPTLTASYSGFVNGDSSSSLTTAPTVTSATPSTASVGTYNNTIAASGAVDNNYSVSYVPGQLTVTPATLTVSGSFAAANKTYDGTTAATIVRDNLTLSGVIDNDSVMLDAMAAFLTPGAGANKTVRLISASLTGADAGNYTLDAASTPTATASIMPSVSELAQIAGVSAINLLNFYWLGAMNPPSPAALESEANYLALAMDSNPDWSGHCILSAAGYGFQPGPVRALLTCTHNI